MPGAAAARLATMADLDRLRACVASAYARYVPRIGREPAPMVADYDDLVARRRVWVIDDAEGCAAVLVGFPDDDHWFVENIAVAPRCQGRGLGRRLVDLAAAEARRLGLDSLLLYTNEAMVEALGFYLRLGFVEVDRRVEDGFRRIYLLKRLAPP